VGARPAHDEPPLAAYQRPAMGRPPDSGEPVSAVLLAALDLLVRPTPLLKAPARPCGPAPDPDSPRRTPWNPAGASDAGGAAQAMQAMMQATQVARRERYKRVETAWVSNRITVLASHAL
jgi:hypothetical protein